MNIAELHHHFLASEGITTDSRKIVSNSIFFALKGENFNGNKFALDALKMGASYAVIDEKPAESDERLILVKDVLRTLQKLANFHRKYLNLPIIGLTGSNGKTTTKELIKSVLETKFNIVATKGNLNNHIGVPLTLLSMDKTTEIGIVEMGANHLKEIEMLCEIAEPNFGYITNFGKAHLEGFGGIEGVIKGKSELYDFLRKTKGKTFLNTDDLKQVEKAEGIESIHFNKKQISLIDSDPFISVAFEKVPINSNLIGLYNYTNIAAAVCIGNYFKVLTEQIKFGIENYTPSNNRSQIISKGTYLIILDAYNANPSSMTVALENFSKTQGKYKVVILGDMFELGKESATEHQQIANLAESYPFDTVLLIGKAFSTTRVKNALLYDTFEAFKASNYKFPENSTFLIKGSRGMALERILDLL